MGSVTHCARPVFRVARTSLEVASGGSTVAASRDGRDLENSHKPVMASYGRPRVRNVGGVCRSDARCSSVELYRDEALDITRCN